MRSLELNIAGRYLMSRRAAKFPSLITLIATGGVTLGVMALIVVMGVMNGLVTDLREKILVASPHLMILTYGKGLRLDDWERAREVALEHPDVVAAAPFVRTEGLFTAGEDYAEGAVILGIHPDTGSTAVTKIADHFLSGDLSFETTAEDVHGGVVVGRALAERLSAFPGTVLQVASAAGARFNASVGAFVPRYWFLEVTGSFETQMFEYDNTYTVMDFEDAQEFAALGTAASGVEVRVRDPWQAGRVGQEIVDELGYPHRYLDWQTQNQELFSALQLEKLGMGLVLLLIVIVAAFNIVSTLTMTVADKRREIGILRAMGLPVRSIRRVFLYQGAAIGLIGTLLGTSLGVVVATVIDKKELISINASVYLIDHLPIKVQPTDVLLIAIAGFLVAVAATMYPSKRAASLHPVDAIRYE